MRNIRAPGALCLWKELLGHTATDTAIDTASWLLDLTGIAPVYRRTTGAPSLPTLR